MGVEMNKFLAVLAALALGSGLFVASADLAAARSKSSGSGHSSSSHVASGKSGSSKTAGKFIRVKCKSASCKSKHPSGYAMVPVKKKTQ